MFLECPVASVRGPQKTGETTSSLMWRINNGNDLAGVPATVAFVSIGTNNLKKDAVTITAH